MGAVKFYHVTQGTLEAAALALITRALDQGWRVMLRSPDRPRLERLDEALWLDPEDSFLPHGLEGGPQDADQPLLLGQGAAANGAQAVLLFPGMAVDPAEARGLERLWVMFGEDEAQKAAARTEWRGVVAAGLVAEYWSDAGGRWALQSASGAAGG